MIPDSGIESGSDSQSEDKLAWKKRKVGHSLVGRQGERVIVIKGNERISSVHSSFLAEEDWRD